MNYILRQTNLKLESLSFLILLNQSRSSGRLFGVLKNDQKYVHPCWISQFTSNESVWDFKVFRLLKIWIFGYLADGNLPWVPEVCFSFLIPERQKRAAKQGVAPREKTNLCLELYFILSKGCPPRTITSSSYFKNGTLEPG